MNEQYVLIHLKTVCKGGIHHYKIIYNFFNEYSRGVIHNTIYDRIYRTILIYNILDMYFI